MEPVGVPEPADVLNGWKEIAAHLGKSARSVQRWERDLSLPVRRIPTPDGGSIVYAVRSEVDGWRARQGELVANGVETSPAQTVDLLTGAPDEVPNRARLDTLSSGGSGSVRWWRAPVPAWVAVAASLAAAIATSQVLDFAGAGGTPATLEIEGRELQAYSDGGRLLWVHSFDQVASRPHSYALRQSPVVDVNLDGENEVIGAVRFAAPRDTTAASDAVFAFESDGTVLWSVQPDLTFTQGDAVFTGPWHVRDIANGMSPDGPRVWIAYSHHTWWPGFVVEVDPDGKSRVRYSQAGRIYTLTYWSTARGTYLVAGGSLHDPHGASLAIADLGGPPARWPTGEAPALTCPACPESDPVSMFLFPSSEVSRAMYRPGGWVLNGKVLPSSLQVSTFEGFGNGGLVTISEDLRVTAVERSDMYWQAHQELEGQGRIHHPVNACPERSEPVAVRAWAPHHGWDTVEIPLRVSVTERGTSD